MKLIYSSGGFSREFLRTVKSQYPDDEIQFVDDNPTGDAISYEVALRLYGGSQSTFIIGFADTKLRQQKTERVLADGFDLCSVFAESCIVGENVQIGRSCVLGDFSILTADLQIGDSFQCNIYSYVAHDCQIGDYVTLAPRVSINGRVEIGDHVYVGTGATILPGRDGKPLRIGKGVIIGAHTLVTKSVPEGVTVVGTPARQIER